MSQQLEAEWDDKIKIAEAFDDSLEDLCLFEPPMPQDIDNDDLFPEDFVQSSDLIEEDQEPPQACDFRLINPDESPLHAVPKTKRPHYSPKLQTLYVQKNQPCPFTFTCPEEYSSDGDVFLRCGMCYLRREDEKKAVTRCFEHRSTGPGGMHVMSYEHDHVFYDTSGEWLSIVVPYSQGHQGEAGRTFVYEFACLSSCSTPLKGKPLQVIFTLEKNGKVIGDARQVVKISSSSWRDMKNAEKKLDKQNYSSSSSSQTESGMSKKRKRKLSPAPVPVKDDDDDDDDSLSYQKQVQEDISFAQYARKKHPDWWTEYHRDMGDNV
jgi:hypothetical protein